MQSHFLTAREKEIFNLLSKNYDTFSGTTDICITYNIHNFNHILFSFPLSFSPSFDATVPKAKTIQKIKITL